MKRQNKRDNARFCGQLNMLLSSGMPLLESLKIIHKLLKRKEYLILIEKISDGESLSEAMKGIFPIMLISAVEGSERAGNLEEVLGRLGKHYEEQNEMEEKVKSALIYPCFIIVLCFFSLFIMFFFVLPGFKTMFSDMNVELPLFTRLIINFGEVFKASWYVPFSFILFLAVMVPVYKRKPDTAQKVDRWLIKIKFVSRSIIAQNFRSLGSLLEGGIPMREALSTVVGSSQNVCFKMILEDIKQSVENGEKISEALSKHPVFPNEAIQMLAVGEGSGKMGEMLINIADFYEREREIFIKRCTSMLEPALILFVGLIVAAVAAAMFLPMVNMLSSLQ